MCVFGWEEKGQTDGVCEGRALGIVNQCLVIGRRDRGDEWK